jgi:hypothetical protein
MHCGILAKAPRAGWDPQGHGPRLFRESAHNRPLSRCVHCGILAKSGGWGGPVGTQGDPGEPVHVTLGASVKPALRGLLAVCEVKERALLTLGTLGEAQSARGPCENRGPSREAGRARAHCRQRRTAGGPRTARARQRPTSDIRRSDIAAADQECLAGHGSTRDELIELRQGARVV